MVLNYSLKRLWNLFCSLEGQNWMTSVLVSFIGYPALVTRQLRRQMFCLLWLFSLIWSPICVRCESLIVIGLYPRSRGTCIFSFTPWFGTFYCTVHVKKKTCILGEETLPLQYLSLPPSIITWNKLLPVKGNLCWIIHTLEEDLGTALSKCSGSWQCCCLH